MKRAVMFLSLVACADHVDSTTQNATCPATTAFAETACICDRLDDVGNLIVGRSVAKDDATLAVMGTTKLINNTEVRGDFLPHGGLSAAGNLQVEGQLASNAAVDDLGNVEVAGDVAIAGDLTGIGRLKVDGALRVGGNNGFVGYQDVGSTAPFQPVAAPSCGCDGPSVIDVAGMVAAAKTHNDNAANHIPTTLRNIGVTRLDLPTGSYYMTDLDAIGATFVSIEGHVSLYLDGSLDHIGAAWLSLANGAMLDLYVSGSVRTIGHVELGNKWDPSAFRLYIGGGQEATLDVGNQLFNGAIYAPHADLVYIGNTQIRGAITAHTIHGTGNLVIGYAAPECPQDDPDPDPDPPPSSEDPPVLL